MKVVYHHRYEQVYASDPAAAPGRMEAMFQAIPPRLEIVEPEPAAIGDILRVHTPNHIRNIEVREQVLDIALLAAGGAIKAAELAIEDEPAFGLIRPPGHHASPDSCWGFCFFNNMAVAIEYLRQGNRVRTAAIVDIDLHFGDGTDRYFGNIPEVSYLSADDRSRQAFLDSVSQFLDGVDADIIAVSAGFDRHEEDWGGLLRTEDYAAIGSIVKKYSQVKCQGHRFGVLEGGYNHSVLGRNLVALLEGME